MKADSQAADVDSETTVHSEPSTDIAVPSSERTILSHQAGGIAKGLEAARRLGPLATLRYRIIFSRVAIDQGAVAALREAAQRGTVVYAVEGLTGFEKQFLHWAALVHDLPTPTSGETLDLSRALSDGSLGRLLERQRPHERPFIVVPLIMLWGEEPMRRPDPAPGWWADIFPHDRPKSALRVAWAALFGAHRSSLTVGAPLNLKTSEDQPAALVWEALRASIDAEHCVRTGPRHATPPVVFDRVLNAPLVQQAIEADADAASEPIEVVQGRAARWLRQMRAKKSARGLRRLSALLRHAWPRLFDAFVIDEGGVARAAKAARQGGLLLLPTHRSHVDYLLMSDLFCARRIIPPHIAAGINLSFFPLGYIFRTAGAFFLRRRYTGRGLYGLLMSSYLGDVVGEGHHVEIFLEGGRSRTGRTLPPRFGLLRVIADRALRPGAPKYFALPASIAYDRVLEARSLTRELSGGTKEAESIRSLFRIPAFFRKRPQYGNANVQFGEPFDLAAFLRAEGYEGPESPPESRHAAIRALGYAVMRENTRLTAVTPTSLLALGFLALSGERVSANTLREACRQLEALLRNRRARFTYAPENLDSELERAIGLMVSEGALHPEGHGEDRAFLAQGQARIRLDYYKNQSLPHLLLPAIAASAVLSGSGPLNLAMIRNRFTAAFEIAEHHFVQLDGLDPAASFDEGFGFLQSEGLIEGEDTIDAKDGHRLSLLSGTFESVIELQLAAARACLRLIRGTRQRSTVENEILADVSRQQNEEQITRYEAIQKPMVTAAINRLCHDSLLVQYGEELTMPNADAVKHYVEEMSEALAKPRLYVAAGPDTSEAP